MPHVNPSWYITFYSVECLFLGMNSVLYGFCAYTLWGQKSLSCRVLFVINTLQFLLCAAQITVHGMFLFVVFTVITGSIRTYIQHVNPYIIIANIIFNLNYAIGNMLSIWRLYVLYDNNLRICFPALLLWIGQVCSTVFTVSHSITHPYIESCFTIRHTMLWVCVTALNLYVATAICYRFYVAQKRTHAVLGSSLFKSIAIILVESSALMTMCNVVGVSLNLRKSIFSLLTLGISTEIAVASSLLITARHAMLTQSRYASNRPVTTTVEFKPLETESTSVDTSTMPPKTENLGSLQSLGDVG